ncbi:WecB/TagA/CpsF family glycosyltransferase [Acetonema longum]|uniref:N-acetylglucosaminyldiphosphoundecaprenol N-acetyl-beta-D-mannosaminyltransferase n=1 Tax=Acetonema longum DSM 6540 TaxID=1009370 RepID=F7NPC0_9FIRM|nr:WecB/TagA/CpsF family glycosyltransferase [Acetonema longum]EGO62082.1 glycosyl transferase, WecB/TagA/CpsF family protein [Acetonema longum DSM 6540]
MTTADPSVLGIKIHAVTKEEALERLEWYIKSRTPHLIATANAEMVMFAQKDRDLADILNAADLIVPDGAGVVWAARHRGFHVPERVTGYDLTQSLLHKASLHGYRVFMLGAAPEVILAAKHKAERLYPGIQIVGIHHGFFSAADEGRIIDQICNAVPDVLLVALGVPKQEKWLYRNLQKLQVPVCMGVGGSFDVMAGSVPRAPEWMQRANLEWFFRLLRQPQRIGRMMALPRFAIRVLVKNR